MSRRTKRLLRRLREGKADAKSLFGIRINAAQMLSDEELAAQNDTFPAGEFRRGDWSAEPISGAQAIRAKLDSFHLVGRRIWNVWTTSHDYFNDKDGLENAVYADLKERAGLSEYRAQTGSSIHALARHAKIPRRMEIDEPLVLEFDSRETFEMDVEIAPTYQISMNRIPLRLLQGKFDNIDPETMFSPVLGRTITSVELSTIPEAGTEDDSVNAILLRLDNRNTLEIRGFYDYLEVHLLDSAGKPRHASIESLRKGFFNYQDLHFDRRTGFEAKDGALFFGGKGIRRVGPFPVAVSPVTKIGTVPCDATAYANRRDALALVLALSAETSDVFSNRDPVVLSIEQWQETLKRAIALMDSPRLERNDTPLARLFFETPPPSHPHPWEKATDENRMKRKRERCRILLSELIRWSRKAIPADGGVRVVL